MSGCEKLAEDDSLSSQNGIYFKIEFLKNPINVTLGVLM